MLRTLIAGCLFLTLMGGAWGEAPETGYTGFILTPGLTGDYLVIQDASGFQAFQKHLPQTLPSQTRPGPANPDPLRRADYAGMRGRWLLVWSQSIYREVILESVGAGDDGTVVVRVRLESDPESEMAARPYDWGRYRLIQIPTQGRVQVNVRSVDRK